MAREYGSEERIAYAEEYENSGMSIAQFAREKQLTGDAEKKRLEWIRTVSAMEEHSALLVAKNEGIAEGEKRRKRRTV